MKYFSTKAAILASLLAGANAAGIPRGCYTSVDPPLEDYGVLEYPSRGSCLDFCKDEMEMPVMALWGGTNCFCGKMLPSPDEKTDDDKCNEKCKAYPFEMCGGLDAFDVLLTGIPGKVPTYSSSSSSSTSTSTTSEEEATSSSEAGTSTATPTDEASDNGGGPNVAGIAAGVVVGVVAVCGLIGGAWFFLKYRKRKDLVDEYRRNATISSFVAGGKPFSEGSVSDSRLEPSMMDHRRQSNGSIADDQDFSRRILKVTNPDSQYNY